MAVSLRCASSLYANNCKTGHKIIKNHKKNEISIKKYKIVLIGIKFIKFLNLSPNIYFKVIFGHMR